MRKITSEAVAAMYKHKPYRKDNTAVVCSDDRSEMYLHDNLIATLDANNTFGVRQLSISTAGWDSRTTIERLNGFPGVGIYTEKGALLLNRCCWDGDWIQVRFARKHPDGPLGHLTEEQRAVASMLLMVGYTVSAPVDADGGYIRISLRHDRLPWVVFHTYVNRYSGSITYRGKLFTPSEFQGRLKYLINRAVS